MRLPAAARVVAVPLLRPVLLPRARQWAYKHAHARAHTHVRVHVYPCHPKPPARDTRPLQVVAAYYTVLKASLEAISPVVMASVAMVTQSELILSDPSNYWISVINVGRSFNLNVLQVRRDAHTCCSHARVRRQLLCSGRAAHL